MNYFRLAALVAMTLLCPAINATPFGAPPEACSSLEPLHGFAPQTSPAPYSVQPSKVGNLYEVSLSGATPFKGFILQARRANEIVGRFLSIPPEAQYLTCLYDQSSVTHVDPSEKSEVKFIWDSQGIDVTGVTFVASFVQQVDTYWTLISSEDISTLP